MGKHEYPPFKMVVEGGRLVPATAYDAERLDTYRRGTKVSVRFTEEKDRVMVRKWWAVLGLVVKQCNVPWQTKDEASEAIKLALGIVNLTKTVGGQFMQYPKSLTELTDPELDDAVRDMMDLIHRMTGIDPATLKKEAADVGDDETESPEETPPAGEGSADAAPDGTPGPSAQAAEPEAGGQEAEDDHAAAPASGVQRASEADKRECLDKFLALATDDLTVQERRDNIEAVKEAWKAALPNDLDFVKACMTTADKVAKGEHKMEPARKYLEGLIR